MRVLLTGGAGFIGAWIIRRLLVRGCRVRSLDLAPPTDSVRAVLDDAYTHVDWQRGDVADADSVSNAANGCDVIIHLAALLTPACQADPIRGAHVNLLGTLNVFEAARSHGHDRVLYMSSAGVFGPDDGVTPRPDTHYGAFKLAGEGCARALFADHGIASLGLRPLIVYGPGREVGLTAGPTLACRAAARGEPYVMPLTGESDFVFVDDVAAVFDATIDAPLEGAEVHNLTGETATMARVVELIRELEPGADIGIDGPRVPVAAHLAPGRIRERLTSVPHTGLADGLARTIAFHRR